MTLATPAVAETTAIAPRFIRTEGEVADFILQVVQEASLGRFRALYSRDPDITSPRDRARIRVFTKVLTGAASFAFEKHANDPMWSLPMRLAHVEMTVANVAYSSRWDPENHEYPE